MEDLDFRGIFGTFEICGIFREGGSERSMDLFRVTNPLSIGLVSEDGVQNLRNSWNSPITLKTPFKKVT